MTKRTTKSITSLILLFALSAVTACTQSATTKATHTTSFESAVPASLNEQAVAMPDSYSADAAMQVLREGVTPLTLPLLHNLFWR
ncbi:hypothetical protein [Alteromonas gracilis]|uniref:hypothetical protein n=1 Tax=Alteromonas gracilis TaxID=1479524 RepID=UPI0032196CA1